MGPGRLSHARRTAGSTPPQRLHSTFPGALRRAASRPSGHGSNGQGPVEARRGSPAKPPCFAPRGSRPRQSLRRCENRIPLDSLFGEAVQELRCSPFGGTRRAARLMMRTSAVRASGSTTFRALIPYITGPVSRFFSRGCSSLARYVVVGARCRAFRHQRKLQRDEPS